MHRHVTGHYFFFFNDTATTEIYTLSLHDALPIVNAVNCLSSDVDGSIEAETEIRATQIVVDGLGHANYFYAVLEELLRDGLRVIAAQDNQRFDAIGLQVLYAGLKSAIFLQGIGSRRAQDCPASLQDSGHGLKVEFADHVVHHAAPAFQEACELVVVMKDDFANLHPVYLVQSWSIPSTGEDANLHLFVPVISF